MIEPAGVAPHRQQGATLLELLIALSIGALMLSALVMLYMQTGRAFAQQQAMADLQARGRLATQVLAREIRQSGFWGELSDPARRDGDTQPITEAAFDIENALPVWGGGAAESQTLGLVAASASLVADSSAVMVRYAGQRSGPCLDYSAQRMLSMSDASGGCTRWRLNQATYHLRALDGGANGLYATRRSNAGGLTTSELVRFIETFSVEWGVDTNDDGSADRFYQSDNIPASWTIADWDRVVAARIFVLARSERPMLNASARRFLIAGTPQGFDDGYLRRLFVTTTTLRNNRLRQNAHDL